VLRQTGGTMTGWHLGPMAGFDLETTGVDVEADRVLTAAYADFTPGRPPDLWHRMCDPGIDIPDGATAVHGITTERARAKGCDPAVLLGELVQRLFRSAIAGVPIVGMNLAFDLTMLDRDCRRHGVTPLGELVTEVAPVVDVLVVDKWVDQYRKGHRTLVDLAERYRIRHDGAHDAAEDCLAACRVAWRIGTLAHMPGEQLRRAFADRPDWQFTQPKNRFAVLGAMPLTELHWAQARWRAEQAASLEEYLRRTDDGVRVDPWWPVRPYAAEVPA
jgi:DNA polymerase-3 subunit epsilon